MKLEDKRKKAKEWLKNTLLPFKDYIKKAAKWTTPSGENCFIYVGLGKKYGFITTPWYKISIQEEGFGDLFPWMPFNEDMDVKTFKKELFDE